ncbi:MAG: carbohydrate binding domain-containing protein [Pyrinomonadaceae bacterium]
MSDLKAIDTNDVKVRIALALGVIVVLAVALFSVRWQLGNMLATLTPETDSNVSDIAEIATRWAPSDPEGFSLKSSAAESQAASIAALEEAVRRSPYDYRWRTDLGRAYEQDDRNAEAEVHLKKAVELAPSYSSARWHLGNFYLRHDQIEKALAELKIAAENSIKYREQVFSLIWDYSGKNGTELEKLAGDRADMRARLAYFFAARGHAEDALRNWNHLGDRDKANNTAIARSMALGLFDQKHFRESLEFARQYGAETEALPETITNGSFEKTIGGDEESRFGWQTPRSDPKFDVTADSRVKHDGNRSLRLTFKGYNKPTFANVLQTVVVESDRKYRLQFWVRTENLRSAGLPLIEIVNANDDKTITRSGKLPAGTADWQQIVVDLTIPSNSSGITIRTIRDFCGEDCSITGILWYDDFSISRL